MNGQYKVSQNPITLVIIEVKVRARIILWPMTLTYSEYKRNSGIRYLYICQILVIEQLQTITLTNYGHYYKTANNTKVWVELSFDFTFRVENRDNKAHTIFDQRAYSEIEPRVYTWRLVDTTLYRGNMKKRDRDNRFMEPGVYYYGRKYWPNRLECIFSFYATPTESEDFVSTLPSLLLYSQ